VKINRETIYWDANEACQSHSATRMRFLFDGIASGQAVPDSQIAGWITGSGATKERLGTK
jgi:hypothetical protein